MGSRPTPPSTTGAGESRDHPGLTGHVVVISLLYRRQQIRGPKASTGASKYVVQKLSPSFFSRSHQCLKKASTLFRDQYPSPPTRSHFHSRMNRGGRRIENTMTISFTRASVTTAVSTNSAETGRAGDNGRTTSELRVTPERREPDVLDSPAGPCARRRRRTASPPGSSRPPDHPYWAANPAPGRHAQRRPGGCGG